MMSSAATAFTAATSSFLLQIIVGYFIGVVGFVGAPYHEVTAVDGVGVVVDTADVAAAAVKAVDPDTGVVGVSSAPYLEVAAVDIIVAVVYCCRRRCRRFCCRWVRRRCR